MLIKTITSSLIKAEATAKWDSPPKTPVFKILKRQGSTSKNKLNHIFLDSKTLRSLKTVATITQTLYNPEYSTCNLSKSKRMITTQKATALIEIPSQTSTMDLTK
jgi:hypothetical protein